MSCDCFLKRIRGFPVLTTFLHLPDFFLQLFAGKRIFRLFVSLFGSKCHPAFEFRKIPRQAFSKPDRKFCNGIRFDPFRRHVAEF